MIIISVIDDKGGLMFNNRRQSQDRILRQNILETVSSGKLLMNSFSFSQFSKENFNNIITDEDFLENAQKDDFCFAENVSLLPYTNKIDKIILFRWNRTYPGDFFFDIPLSEEIWHLVSSEDFEGSSHEKITKEIYEK